MKAKQLEEEVKFSKNKNTSQENSKIDFIPLVSLKPSLNQTSNFAENNKIQKNTNNNNEIKFNSKNLSMKECLKVNVFDNLLLQNLEKFPEYSEFLSSENSLSQKALLFSKCHPSEILDREERKNINIFEIDPKSSLFDSNSKKQIIKINPEYAIKAFKRSAADVKMDNPEFLRPPKVLFSTVKYLIDNIIDIDSEASQMQNNLNCKYFQYPNEPFTFKDICLFAEDRFRAIRQDFIILAPKASLECIQSHEINARFLILSLNECLDYKAFSGSQGLFKLIIQQLNATLTSLREFYEYVEKKFCDNRIIAIINANKDEFISYSLLLSVTDNFDLVSMINLITQDIKDSTLIKHTVKIVRCIISRDFLTFFKILKNQRNFNNHSNFDYLITCIMTLYLKDMRKVALDSFSCKVEKKVFNYMNNIKYILDLLAFEDFKEFYDFLNWYGIKFPIEIRKYIDFLKKIETLKENPQEKLGSVILSEKQSNIGSEENIDLNIQNNNENHEFISNGIRNNKNNDISLNVDINEQTLEEIKSIFENYDNPEFFYSDEKGELSRFFYMEFYVESNRKDESNLFRVTNKRFVEKKKNKLTRKEILIEK